MKKKVLINILVLLIVVLSGCTAQEDFVSENIDNVGYTTTNIPETTSTSVQEYGIRKEEAIEGNRIIFGYHKQQLEWIVLTVEDDKALLLSKQGLDLKKYNSERMSVTWETYTLRNWLNNEFYNSAFSFEEKNAILKTTLVNEDNYKYGTSGGNETEDKIFLLSKTEADKYLSDENRTSIPTDYVKNYIIGWNEIEGADAPMRYWLRTSGDYGHHVMTIDSKGKYEHIYEVSNLASVRPAIWVKVVK